MAKRKTATFCRVLPLALCGLAGALLPAAGLAQDARPASVVDWNLEYSRQDNLALIGAPAAHARGLSGKGTVVAIADTGVDLDHPDLADTIVPGGRDFLDKDRNANPRGQGNSRSHGTHVAGIVAARINRTGVVGVAPGAGLLPLRVLPSQGGAAIDLAGVIAYATDNGADIVNNSWGADSGATYRLTRRESNRIRRAIDRGTLVVFAAGNDGAAQPSAESLIPRRYTALEDGWLSVTAVNNDKRLAGYSNACGAAKDWCLAAPGHRITGAADGDDEALPDGYAIMSGTSMAAPHVSGALALLQELFPHLSSAERREILLTTAEDIGKPGIDSVFGHGLLDLDEALRPQGTATIATGASVSGQRAAFNRSRIGLAGAAHFTRSLGATPVSFLDGYDRAFVVPLAALVAPGRATVPIERRLRRFGQTAQTGPLYRGGDAHIRLALAPDTPLASDAPLPDEAALDEFRRRLVAESRFGNFSAGLNRRAELHYGPVTDLAIDPGTLLGSNAFGNPFLGFVSSGGDAHYQTDLGQDGTTLQIGGAYGTPGHDAEATSIAALAALTQRVGRLDIGVQTGLLLESKRILGSVAEGAFAVQPTRTTFFGASGRYALSANTTLYAAAFAGLSNVRPAENSLVSGASKLVSTSFGLGLVRRDPFNRGGRLRLSLSRPLQIAAGSLRLTVPVGRRGNDILRETVEADLSPSGHRYDLEGAYSLQVDDAIDVTGGLLIRYRDQRESAATIDNVALMRLNWRF